MQLSKRLQAKWSFLHWYERLHFTGFFFKAAFYLNDVRVHYICTFFSTNRFIANPIIYFFILSDINECQERPNICGFGRCVNELGTYSCLCQRGYKYNPVTKTCTCEMICNFIILLVPGSLHTR